MGVASQSRELSLSGCQSPGDRLQAKFKVSVAKTRFQDIATRAELPLALVASDGRITESTLSKVDGFVEVHGGAIIVRVRREVY
jgi:uncharacterized protein YlxP (DUF503 family)